MGRDATNALARDLFATHESDMERLIPPLIDLVAAEVGLPSVPPDHKWPIDIVGVTREFLFCIATDDLDRLREPGGMMERLGSEAARGDIPFKVLAQAIRVANRRIQAQVHRALLARGGVDEPEAMLALLARVVRAGEVTVAATRRGYKLASVGHADADEVVRRLASALIYGTGRAAELADAMGWADGTHVCVIIAAHDDVAAIRRAADVPLAYHAQDDAVILIHPVGAGKLATSLRAQLAGTACVVGPVVPLAEVPGAFSLTLRLSRLAGERAPGPLFADGYLLELACSADLTVAAALRRKYFVEVDQLPADQRALLVGTLRQWLLQWGHRPGIAEALAVHPQTVSGRINRLKDLLSDDLEDPRTRSELLVLIIAEGGV